MLTIVTNKRCLGVENCCPKPVSLIILLWFRFWVSPKKKEKKSGLENSNAGKTSKPQSKPPIGGKLSGWPFDFINLCFSLSFVISTWDIRDHCGQPPFGREVKPADCQKGPSGCGCLAAVRDSAVQ